MVVVVMLVWVLLLLGGCGYCGSCVLSDVVGMWLWLGFGCCGGEVWLVGCGGCGGCGLGSCYMKLLVMNIIIGILFYS